MTSVRQVSLPSILHPDDREALGRLGFRSHPQPGEKFASATLPPDWTAVHVGDRWIYSDSRGRDRVHFFPKATFETQGVTTADGPIQIEMPGLQVLRRFKLSDDGDPHYRVFDRVRGTNLTGSFGETLGFDSREQAMAYLDDEYPRWNGHVLEHWDDVDLTA